MWKVCMCSLILIFLHVYVGAFLHACMKSELLSCTRDVCLLIINAHRYLACSDTSPQPPTLNTYTHTQRPAFSAMSCQSLLGLAFSLARGLDPLSDELNSGPFPLSTPRERQKPTQAGKQQTWRKKGQTGSQSQGLLMISDSLCLIICWNVFNAEWVLQFTEKVPKQFQSPPPLLFRIIVSSSKPLREHPQVYQKASCRREEMKLTKAHLPYE